jgi:hypothetical protein
MPVFPAFVICPLSIAPQTNVHLAAWLRAPGHHEAALASDGVWILLLTTGKAAAPELMQDFFTHFELDELLQASDAHGRNALDVATPACKAVLQSKLCVPDPSTF